MLFRNMIGSFRLAARRLLQQPSHSLLVVGMLALGIAGNTVIFSLVHALLIEPLAFDEPEQLVYLDVEAPKWGLERVSIAYSDFHAWRESNRTFDSMALSKGRAFNVVVGDDAERLQGAYVTHDMTQVLRVQPRLGRMFSADEDRPGAAKVAVISHGLWHRLFAGSPNALGQSLDLDGERHEIVGVLPRGVAYPEDAELWVPIAGNAEEDFGSYRFEGIGRLNPDAGVEQARTDLDAALAPLKEKYPFKNDTSAVVVPLRDEYVQNSRSIAWGLQAAVLLVLLVACANVAGLLLARGSSRAREIGVRMALGAERKRVVGQLLAESFLLASAGAVVGVFLGYRGLAALGTWISDSLPFWVRFEPNAEAMILCVTVSMATVLVFGLVPAWQTTRIDLQSTLRSSVTRVGQSRGRRRLLDGLVAAEVALAQLLLVGAGLVALSQARLLAVDPGFHAERVLAFSLSLPNQSYPEDSDVVGFFDQLQEQLAAIPGVRSASISDHPPLHGHDGNFFEIEGQPRDPDAQRPVTLVRLATDEYPDTVGLPLLKGRFVRRGGLGEDAPKEVVVNESFAGEFFGGRDPVGLRIRFDGGPESEEPWLTVVGLARDVRHYGLAEDPRPGVYLPQGFFARRHMVPVLHTEVEPLSILPQVRDIVRRLDPQIAVFQVTTLEQELYESLTLQRLTARLFGLFALVALLLAAAGAYATLSYAVHQQRRDLGVRLALGARPDQVLRGVLARGLIPVALGAVLGLIAAGAAGRVLSSLLHGVDAHDPRVFAGVAAILGLVAVVANTLPALRASRVDPMHVLREE